ncbi:MAG: response regulator [Steroidobacteraceae bacterium]|nr:response regulator [Steroidobacteraceae bacterium]
MTYRDQRGRDGQSLAPSATPILIIDGDRNVGVSLAFMLGVSGYDDVRYVRSAARAIAVAEKYRPAIVFLEIELAGGEGYELASQLRRNAKQRAIRLIALTTDSEHASRDQARNAGFDRFLVKPATQDELDKCLGKMPASAS